MAALLSDLQSEVSCPVCLEYFTDPVTIDCGHSYCRRCITLSWGSAGGPPTCPQCRRECTTTDLPRNVQLSNLVEIAQRMSLRSGESADLCERHREPIKLFCEEDQRGVCTICDRSRVHQGHTVTPIEEAAEQYQFEYSATLEHLQKELDNIVRLQANEKKKSAEFKIKFKDERERIEAEFKELYDFLEKEKRRFLSKLETEEKETLHMLNESITRLSEHTSLLNELITTIEERSKLSLIQQLKDVKSFLSRFKSETIKMPEQVSTERSNSIYSFSKELVLMKMSAKYSGGCDVSGSSPGMEELRIVLFDLTQDGTHAALNTLLGSDQLEVKSVMGECTKRSCVRDGKRIVVIDWPLFLDVKYIKEKHHEEDCKFLTFGAPGPHAIVLVLKVGQIIIKVGKAVACIKRMFLNREESQKRMLIMFSGKERLGGQTIDQYIQESGAALKDLIAACGNRYCVISSRARGAERAQERSEVMALIGRLLQLQGGAFYTEEVHGEIEKGLLRRVEAVKAWYSEEAKIEEEAIKSQCEHLIKDLEGEKDSAEKTQLLEEVRREMTRKLQESERKYQIKLEGVRDGAEVTLAFSKYE